MITVVVADDQALVRGGLRMILDQADDIDVVGEAEDGEHAVRMVRELRPDVDVMDVRMPRVDGIETTRRLTADPSVATHVLMLTTYDVDQHLYDAIRAGASGFFLKIAPPRQLLDAVRTVAAGDALLAPTLTRRLMEEYVRRPPPGHSLPPIAADLTDREVEVLRLIARGMSNKEISEQLVVGEATVKTHVNRLFRKLVVRDRVHAVVVAYECGLVHPCHAGEPVGPRQPPGPSLAQQPD